MPHNSLILLIRDTGQTVENNWLPFIFRIRGIYKIIIMIIIIIIINNDDNNNKNNNFSRPGNTGLMSIRA